MSEFLKVKTAGEVLAILDEIRPLPSETVALEKAFGTIEVTRPVAPGENVLGVGDDIREGEKIFVRGKRLLPQDIGVLAALGLTELKELR